MSLKVLVIGSGLSAVGAIKALKEHGIRPTVIDRGEKLDSDQSKFVAIMAKKNPDQWSTEDRHKLGSNSTLKNGSSIPKKLLFGSDFFYGKSIHEAPVHAEGNFPPFSYSLGGLSAGWGAAVLPPKQSDIGNWPVSEEILNKYCSRVLVDLPYSARNDGLSLDFPVLSHRAKAIRSSNADKFLLNALKKSVPLEKGFTVFGQSRLMVSSGDNDQGCKYCGECMSGCVYGSIYKASDEILGMHEKDEIEYLSGLIVERVDERDHQVIVSFRDNDGVTKKQIFDRVFIAAGAVNSLRIVLESLRLYKQKVPMLSRGGFVMPMLSFRRLPTDWPNCNTQPGLFLEFRSKLLKHWVHVQISPESELLLRKLSIDKVGNGILYNLKRFIANHIYLIFVNYHSDHSGNYELWLEANENNDGASTLHSVHKKSYPSWRVWLSSWVRLLTIFGRIGCFPLFPMAKLNSGAYHVGGTLPMKNKPVDDLDTDYLGRLSAWKIIHIVDTATFPCLPGTTLGLLTMANAYRIVDNLNWLKK